MTKVQHFFLVFIFGLLISFPIILPYFRAGYFPSHDGEWAVVRAVEMFREIRDLQIPPRFSQALNFGYGYPLFNFVYPGPYYLTTLIHGFGVNFADSVKVLFAASVPLSFFAMYIFSYSVFKKKSAGIVSAVLYIYLPYRMVDLYVRGNIGETLSFFLFPLIFWSLYNVVSKRKKTPFIILGSILIFTLIVSHNIMSVYLGITIFIFILACIVSGRIKEALFVMGTVLWGGLLSAYFIIPALFEKKFIKVSIIPIADRNLYFVTLNKILFSTFGYGTPTDSNPFTYQLGLPHILSSVFSIFYIEKKHGFEKNLVFLFFLLLIFLIFMMFPFSSEIWKLPFLSEINYPWTLLMPIGFLISFLAGTIVFLKKGVILGVIFCILAVLFYYPYAKPENYVNRGDEFYMTNEGTTTSSQELMPLWVDEFPSERFSEKVEAEGESYATNIYYDSKKISFSAEMKESGKVTVNTIYYPGWKAYKQGVEIPIYYDNPKGVMELNLEKGMHNIYLHFSETPLRIVSNTISAISFLAVLGAIFAIIVLSMQRKKRLLKRSS